MRAESPNCAYPLRGVPLATFDIPSYTNIRKPNTYKLQFIICYLT